MKNLLVITVLLILVSCQKQASKELATNIDKIGNEKMRTYLKDDTVRAKAIFYSLDTGTLARRVNQYQFYFTCANSWGDENNVGCKGLAAEVDVAKLRVGSATMKSWWIAMTARYTDSAGNQIKDWSQFGYAVDKGGIFPAFFRYRWVNGTMGQIPPTIIYSGNDVPLVYGTKIRFEIKNIEGTTWWTFSRNDIEVFRADLEITETNSMLEACTESWAGLGFSPAIMTYYLDRFKDGVWSHIPTGIANSLSWGINGQVQQPDFIQSQFVVGGNTSFPVGTPWLWHP